MILPVLLVDGSMVDKIKSCDRFVVAIPPSQKRVNQRDFATIRHALIACLTRHIYALSDTSSVQEPITSESCNLVWPKINCPPPCRCCTRLGGNNVDRNTVVVVRSITGDHS